MYIDDILIYSKNKKEHQEHVRRILAKLKEARLYAKAEKCEFIISANGIEMDPAKVKAILDWETPRSVKDVQCFLGFANFYRRFIHKHSNMCQPLFNPCGRPSVATYAQHYRQR